MESGKIQIIQRENCDRVWLLGDYFDDYGDTVAQVEQACEVAA